jgi:hypothetical protein
MHGETVLYNPATRTFCVLNVTAAFIWDQLEEDRTAAEIAARLCERFDGVDGAGAERDVRDALNRLVEQEMVTGGHDAAVGST